MKNKFSVALVAFSVGLVERASAQPGTGQELTVSSPVVTIGGATATIGFGGLAPGFVGLDQINVEVPKGLSGNQPLVVSIGAASIRPVLRPLQ